MASHRSNRPSPSEYNPFYAGYVNSVPDGDVVETLINQQKAVLEWVEKTSAADADYRYAPDKWSAKEVLGHMVDTEWIFTYRALRFARGDQSALPGMDQDQFMAGANFADRSLEDISAEFSGLRTASIRLLTSFSEELLSRTGTASDSPISVRALCWIIAGHCQHHLKILKERYVVPNHA